jgi:thioredoxin 1
VLFKEGKVIWQQAGVIQMPQLQQIIEQKLKEFGF